MKKIILTLLILFLLMFPIKSKAMEPFVKSTNNPLPLLGTYPNWNEQRSFQPSIIFEDGRYKMWYDSLGSNDSKIGFATSTDGLSWQRQALLNPDPNFSESDPFIFIKDGVKTLYFASVNNGSKIYKINMINDTEYDLASLQLVIFPTLSWEGVDNTSPSVIFDNGIYYLFYSGHNSIWRVGMATSTDGLTWTKCPSPILNLNGRDEPSDGPEIFKKNGQFHLFFHMADTSGIKISQTTALSCSSNWSMPDYILKNDKTYDVNYLTSPSVLEKNEQILLYYGGKGTDGIWRISLATSGNVILPTPTPTLISTPTPTQTKEPIVIIPGIFSSWNKKALVYNQSVTNEDWTINPIVHEYDGITTTLENIGYKKNIDYYLFNYDWRQNLSTLSETLKNYLNEKVIPNHPSEKINLVGHSLGGLISRIYRQDNPNSPINKIVTVGSPHQGVAQVYKTAEAGEIDKSNSFLWLAEKILLQIYRDGLKTDKQIVQKKLPIIKDLLPTFDFIKKQNSENIAVQNMQIKNDYLLNKNSQNFDKSSLFTIVGQKGNTDSGYKVGSRSLSDQILNLYPDGRPTDNYVDIGDYTVLVKSAVFGDNNKVLDLGHGELIYKKSGLNEIFNNLGINVTDENIVEGKGTNIDSSLFFLIMSPVKLIVEHNDQVFSENDGIIFVENADSGEYVLKVQGIDNGTYSILVGQIGNNTDVWSKIDGQIANNNPQQQIDQYKIIFDKNSPKEIFYSQDGSTNYFDELITYLKIINKSLKSKNLEKVQKQILNAKENLKKKQVNQLKNNLLAADQETINLYQRTNNSEQKNKLITAVGKLEILYGSTLPNSRFSKKQLQLEFWITKNRLAFWEEMILFKKYRKQNVNKYSGIYLLVKTRLEAAEKNLNSNQLALTDVYLKNVKNLLNRF